MSLKNHKWDLILILALTLVALFTRFYQLDTPPKIVSDEHYFVDFGRHYLSHTFYHDVHPPLGKFFIASGMKIFGDTPFGWRFFTALFGSLLIPLAYLLARKIFKNYFIPLIFSLFFLFDGLFLVQSRMARLDVIYSFFILLAYLLFFCFLGSNTFKKAHLFLILAGIFFGLSISTKWLALAGLGPILILWLNQTQWWQNTALKNIINFLPNIRLPGYYFILYFIVIPFSLYFLVWQIHYGLTATKAITWYENYKILTYHENITEVHTYGSPFWSWPLDIQPFPYFFEKAGNKIKVIVELGNPLVWWPSLVGALYAIKKYLFRDRKINLLLLIFLTHFLPFIFIKRSLFLYHFLPAAPFLWLIFIYLLNDHWQKNKRNKVIITGYLLLVFFSFIFFWPVLTGQEISQDTLNLRAWLPSWFSIVK
ncbi:MAG: phospholipid carrier-dependent glycosyltransferase [Patescibacteria group bacterium]